MSGKCKHCKADIPDFEEYSQAGTCCARRWWDRQGDIQVLVKYTKTLEAKERRAEQFDLKHDPDYGDFLYEQMKDKKAGLQ